MSTQPVIGTIAIATAGPIPLSKCLLTSENLQRILGRDAAMPDAVTSCE